LLIKLVSDRMELLELADKFTSSALKVCSSNKHNFWLFNYSYTNRMAPSSSPH
jgi:hypothetical protein